jgi:hypothetical protein
MMRLQATTFPLRGILAGLLTIVALVIATSQYLTYLEPTRHAVRTSQRNVMGLVRNGTLSTKTDRTGTKSQGPSGQANPLWAIPLSSLSTTRNRPIFSATRRLSSPVQLSSASPSSEKRPPFALVGAIAGQSEGIAIILDERTKSTIRLKTGETHLGWTLRGVKGREATLQNDNLSAILELPGPPASRARRN